MHEACSPPARHSNQPTDYDVGFASNELGLVFRNDGEPYCIVVRVTGVWVGWVGWVGGLGGGTNNDFGFPKKTWTHPMNTATPTSSLSRRTQSSVGFCELDHYAAATFDNFMCI